MLETSHLVLDRESFYSDQQATAYEILAAPCPCDSCEFTRVCASRRLACEAFREYVGTGRIGLGDRVPSSWGYRRVFGAQDESQQPTTANQGAGQTFPILR